MDEDGELVMRARNGDTAAYERLVERHAGIAFRTACVLAGTATSGRSSDRASPSASSQRTR